MGENRLVLQHLVDSINSRELEVAGVTESQVLVIEYFKRMDQTRRGYIIKKMVNLLQRVRI